MDVRCRRCGEPWEAYGLRHDMSWHTCDACGRTVVPASGGGYRLTGVDSTAVYCDHAAVTRHIEPANNGQVPDQVHRWYQQGQPGWLRFVASGLGCPYCHGDKPHDPPPQLSLADLDDLDAATEGTFVDWL